MWAKLSLFGADMCPIKWNGMTARCVSPESIDIVKLIEKKRIIAEHTLQTISFTAVCLCIWPDATETDWRVAFVRYNNNN